VRQIERLLGPPTSRSDKPPAKVWTYETSECTVSIFFYADVNTRVFRSLTYAITNGGQEGGSEEQCLAPLMQRT